ncbi:hypothetical protein GUITHDRAFT_115853 [Guillardia theta CCMP2712]|uniref:Uncharacterized protein n=2 Tax=Guillardia theta TaxID=55529 RepID=L1IP73_GUITC|nr:hypothetical protein GUITHDRAFT_115853 [Guillardia theta CCMP2712]EKX38091.1 hypothetical protein GUITHDRAFT_115853 [Guillardia theta CCMP2712]|mmetsp:Transcript_29987/g.96167  ORF Transcript_29987/g.96167 Transcript_29987/m.96167 type:complete len:233 (+) Transcript_29987:248-946(+)|eukprot:XP_005825071.1 hypothetical protein GUITHDRAFT_115853 [Guillardia theta CCMP2712]
MTDAKANDSFDHDANNAEESSGRPVRRSRLLSDDARLALQLQEQELRAARGGFQTSRKRSKPSSSPRKSSSGSTQKAKTSQPEPQTTAKSRQKVSTASGGKKAAKPATKSASNKTQPSKARSSSKKSKTASSHQDDGFVQFGLEPWPGSDEAVPAVKSKSLRLEEDSTVMSIKRLIIDEAYPGENLSKIEVRTKAGMLLGQDHSLRYVRQFLWPESRGDLVLYYSKGKDSLF